MQKKILETITLIIPGDFLMFYEVFLSLQLKRCGIVTYKIGIQEASQELVRDLRIRNWRNYEKLGKCLNFIDTYPSGQCSGKNENFVDTIKQFLKNRK